MLNSPFPNMFGRLCCAISLAACIAQADAAVVMLENGDRINGTLIELGEDIVRLRHPELGELKIRRSDILQLDISEEEQAELDAAQARARAEREAGLLGTGWLQGWDRRVEAGISGSNNSSSEVNLTAGLFGSYRDDIRFWDFRSQYRRKDTEGSINEHNAYADLERRWFFDADNWFPFAEARYDWDEFKSWDHRATAAAGFGRGLFDTASFDLNAKVGVGGNRTWGRTDDELRSEGLLGVDFKWQISHRQSLIFDTTFYPSFDQHGQYRLLSLLDWLVQLDAASGLAFKLGLTNEYDTREDPNNDFKYAATLVLNL